MAFILKGIGDANSRVNEITPRFDAMILHYLAQHTPGVCWQFSNRLIASASGLNVWVFPGMVQAFGYFGMSDASVSLPLVRPASGTQFARIFAEINLSSVPNRFRIGITPQSTSSNISLMQNNLATTPNGIHQIALYLVQINSAGAITLTDQRPRMERVQNANHALNANDAIRATQLVANGSINTSATAVTQTRTNSTTRVATTAFVHSVVDWANRMNAPQTTTWYGHITFPNGLIMQWWEGSSQNETFIRAFPSQCFLVAYVGQWHADHGMTSNSIQARQIAVNRNTITRTGFRWTHQSGTGQLNQRRYIAYGN